MLVDDAVHQIVFLTGIGSLGIDDGQTAFQSFHQCCRKLFFLVGDDQDRTAVIDTVDDKGIDLSGKKHRTDRQDRLVKTVDEG